ncbi:sugar phosphate nucleotidyltransferase [Vibrio hepatarius]|uniref:phosphocholine cytidylyltransferase family protein n=1 Tax=Vibrio hepatarius TaxID=171383 RepID=UPI001C09DC2C|nr:phosphocholine cytidylyltransferase family protein [Vibrio hepatarius]MBU2895096.1 phosphocholine cytidylyltransferase family protein [Vibrio hepatarius]
MTRAIILAAGQGTRLRPLTNNKPKCLVSLMGKPLIQHQIEVLNAAGINEIHIVTGYCHKQLEHLGHGTSINNRFEQTNMVESLFSARAYFEDCEQDLLICYGDIVYQKNNLDTLLDNEDEIGLMIDKSWRDLWALRLDDPLDDAETLLFNEYGYIRELGRKPTSYEQIQGQYTGLIKVRADKINSFIKFYNALDRFAIYEGKDFNHMDMTTFLQSLIDSDWNVGAAIVNNGWLEVDSVDDLKCYEKMAQNGELDKFYKV